MTVHHGDHDEIRTVIGHQELPPYGLMERYKLRVQLIPLDDDEHGLADDFDDDDTDDYRTSRGGSTRTSARKRRQIQSLQQFKNATNKTTKATLIEKWVDGADLKLWEIKQYWTLYESDRKYRTQGILFCFIYNTLVFAYFDENSQPSKASKYDRCITALIRFELLATVLFPEKGNIQTACFFFLY
jgi:hypothetical protein